MSRTLTPLSKSLSMHRHGLAGVQLWAYVDDISVFGSDRKEVDKVYDRIYPMFSRRKLPLNPQSVCIFAKTLLRSSE